MTNLSERKATASVVTFRAAGVAVIAAVAYMIGTQGAIEPAAHAEVAATRSGDTITVNEGTPPVVVLSANQRAIVGSADGLYYLVDYDGNSVEVKGHRRAALEWHRGPVPPITR